MSKDKEEVELVVKINNAEAKKKMEELEATAKSLKVKIAESQDPAKTKELRKELSNTNEQLKTMRKNSLNINEAMKNLSSQKAKDLKNTLKLINAELNSPNVVRGSAEWNNYQGMLRKVKAEMKTLREESQLTQSWLSRANSTLSKWGGTITTFIAGATGVTLALSKMRSDAMGKEEAQDHLQALTGLNEDSIAWLTEQSNTLSTSMTVDGLRIKQSSEEILKAYMLVGSAKPELLENKEALNKVTIEAMRLAQAAKIDLTQAVNGVTLAMNQYGAEANQASRYTNVMAAGSKYGAASVESITAAVVKSGVAAASAGVPIEQLVGSIETLAEKGVKDEVAGTGLKTFFLRLQTGSDETNPKIVGLQTALQNLQNLSDQEIVAKFGQEAYTVAKVMIDGTESVEQYTAAVTGTSVAIEQAAINSDNSAAKVAQMKNAMKEAGIELIEKLNPSINLFGTYATNLIKILPPIISFIQAWGKWIFYAAASVVALNTGLKIQAYWQTLVYSNGQKGILLMKLDTAWRTIQTNGLKAYILQTSLAKTATQLFNTALKENPIGLILAGVVLLGEGIYKLAQAIFKAKKEYHDLADMTNAATENITSEKAQLEALIAIAKDDTKAKNARLAAIEKINKLSPTYLGNLTLETINTQEAKKAVDSYTKSLLTLTKAEVARTKLGEIQLEIDELSQKKMNDRVQRDINVLKKRAEIYKNAIQQGMEEEIRVAATTTITATPVGEESADTQEKERLAKIEERYRKEQIYQLARYASGEIDKLAYDKWVEESDIALLNKKMELYDRESAEYQELYKEKLQLIIKQNEAQSKQYLTQTEEQKKKAIALVEQQIEKEKRLRKNWYADGILDQEGYEEELFLLEKQELEQKRDLYIGGTKEYLDYQHQLEEKALEAKIKRQEEFEQKLESFRQEFAKKSEAELMQESLDTLEKYHSQGLILEDEYQRMKAAIEEKYRGETEESQEGGLEGWLGQVEKAYSQVSATISAYTSYMSACQDVETAKVEAAYDARIDAAGDNATKTEQLEEEKEAAIAKIEDEYTRRQANIQIAQAIAEGSMATLYAYSAGNEQGGPVIGAIYAALAAASAAMQIATIKKNVEATTQYYDGGFTGEGIWNEEKGVVHAGEFVANRYAVRNKQILPALQLIDAAQKNNTIGSLTARDVSAALNSGSFSPAVQRVSPTTTSNDSSDSSVIISYIQSSKGSIDKLNNSIKNGIKAIVTIDGNEGFDAKYKRYNKLKENKNR